jgi:hypothetical protein
MQEVNNNINKRIKSGKSNKLRWESQEFRDKMSKRNSRPKTKYKMISPNGEIFFWDDGIESMCERFKFNIRLVRQFRNTNIKVEHHTKTNWKKTENTLNTIDWLFYTI